jgi:hypothetical protein
MPHYAHSIDRWDDASGSTLLEHLSGVNDFLLARACFAAAVERWPGAKITLRNGARISAAPSVGRWFLRGAMSAIARSAVAVRGSSSSGLLDRGRRLSASQLSARTAAGALAMPSARPGATARQRAGKRPIASARAATAS